MLDRASAQSLPLHYAYIGPRVRPFAQQHFDERDFSAWFDPGAALLPPGSRFGPELAHVMDELRFEDFAVTGYDPHPKIDFKVAV